MEGDHVDIEVTTKVAGREMELSEQYLVMEDIEVLGRPMLY